MFSSVVRRSLRCCCQNVQSLKKKLKLRDKIHVQDDWRWLVVNLVSVLLL